MSIAWTDPKTTWQDGESFDLSPDFARIQGNFAFLQALALPLYPNAYVALADTPAENSFAFVSFFNGTENMLRTLSESTISENAFEIASFTSNSRVWSAADLNRIESAQLLLYQQLQGQAAHRSRLQFILKGSEF